MIDFLHVAALTPARGGSKSILYKNLQLLGGRPLLAWPIETAFATPEIDDVFVSTDDQKISRVARELSAEIHERPAALSGDKSIVVDTIRHFQKWMVDLGRPVDILVLLEATSPFRTSEMISRCLHRLVDEQLDSIATFSEATVNPERCWSIKNGLPQPFIDGAIPWMPRQQLTPAYQLNGAVYAFRLDKLPEEGPSVIFGRVGAEIVSSEEVIDIDNKKDLVVANVLLES